MHWTFLLPPMKLSDFDYQLDPAAIAQAPRTNREESRLLLYDAVPQTKTHGHFGDIATMLQAGDVLVVNDSKVIPARLHGHKPSGGAVEVFLVRQQSTDTWECLVRNRGTGEQVTVTFPGGLTAQVGERTEEGTYWATFNRSGEALQQAIEAIGEVPLPPYITERHRDDRERYQTVYADANKAGSVAAPTAGLHFSAGLLARLQARGVQVERVTLHVGLGTFQPVRAEDIEEHRMHAELASVDAATVSRLAEAKREGRRIIAVGTTTVRVLEGVVADFLQRACTADVVRDVAIFIRPGYDFKMIDALVTNFHLPKSTLMMLVSAFLEYKGVRDGVRELKRLYAQAQADGYRFFSYGDAMFIY